MLFSAPFFGINSPINVYNSVTLTTWLKCDALSGGSLYNQVTSSYDTPVLGTASIVSEPPRTVLYLPNNTSYINMANKVNFSSGTGIYSLSFWIKVPTSNLKQYISLAIFGNSPAGASGDYSSLSFSTFIDIQDNNKLYYYSNNTSNGLSGGNTATAAAPSTLPGFNFRDGNFHHIVWIIGPSKSITYVDSVFWKDFSATAQAFNFNASGTVSCMNYSSWTGGTESSLGYYDNIQLYSGVLTSNQIAIIYNGGVI